MKLVNEREKKTTRHTCLYIIRATRSSPHNPISTYHIKKRVERSFSMTTTNYTTAGGGGENVCVREKGISLCAHLHLHIYLHINYILYTIGKSKRLPPPLVGVSGTTKNENKNQKMIP